MVKLVTNKDELKVEMPISGKTPNVIIIEGQKYIMDKEVMKKIDNVDHVQKVVFKKFDEKEYKKNLKIVLDVISKKTTKDELLFHILKDIDMKTLRRLVKRIKDKKPIKRHNGCIGFKIGDAYLQLVD